MINNQTDDEFFDADGIERFRSFLFVYMIVNHLFENDIFLS
jgi:hypothetical protein